MPSSALIPLAAVDLHLGEFVPPVLACAVYLVGYFRRVRTLGCSRHEAVPRWRQICFAVGVLTTTAVQLPPLDDLADRLLVAHMIQHIVIGDVASFLIVLGITGPVLQPVLRLRASRVLRRLAGPLLALFLWAVDLYGWHLPVLYQAAIRHDLIHALEHACLLWFGTLLWLALLGPLPKPGWFHGGSRLLYVFGVRLVGTVLGNVLIWAQTVFYPIYQGPDAARGLSAHTDQSLAGGVMMVEQAWLTTILLGWLFYRYIRRESERQELLDLARRRGIELSEERAARAADAGTTAKVRERLLSEAGSEPPQR